MLHIRGTLLGDCLANRQQRIDRNQRCSSSSSRAISNNSP